MHRSHLPKLRPPHTHLSRPAALRPGRTAPGEPIVAGTGGDRPSRHEEVRLTHHDREGWLRAVQGKNGIACIAMGSTMSTGPWWVPRLRCSGIPRLAALEYVVLKSAWDQAHGKNAPRGCMGTGSISPMRPTVTDSRRSTRCMPGS